MGLFWMVDDLASFTVTLLCVCVSLWEALQEPSWPELPLYTLSPGRGGGRGPRGDRGTTHSSAA